MTLETVRLRKKVGSKGKPERCQKRGVVQIPQLPAPRFGRRGCCSQHPPLVFLNSSSKYWASSWIRSSMDRFPIPKFLSTVREKRRSCFHLSPLAKATPGSEVVQVSCTSETPSHNTWGGNPSITQPSGACPPPFSSSDLVVLFLVCLFQGHSRQTPVASLQGA